MGPATPGPNTILWAVENSNFMARPIRLRMN